MVDDSHAVGFIGATAAAARHEHRGVHGPHRHHHRHARQGAGRRVGRLHVAARKEIVDWLRQRSRPYLFSNTLAPVIAAATLARARHARGRRRAARAAARQRRATSARGMHEARLQARCPASTRSFPSCSATRRSPAKMARSPAATKASTSIGFSFPVVPQGQGAHPHADVGGAHARATRSRRRRLRQGRARARRHRRARGSAMKALVKAKREPGIWMEDVPEPEIGPNDVLIRVQARPPSAAPTCTSTTGTSGRRRPSPCRWPSGHEFCGEIVEVGSEVRGFKPGDRVSGEGHITCGHCRNCRAGRRHLCRNTRRRRRQPPGLLRRVRRRFPAVNAFKLPGRDPRRDRRDPRPARQRHAHRAVLRPGRRGRADHRRRPDRHHGRRDRPPRRRAPRRRHRRQRLPPRPRAQDGRDARGQRRAARRSTTS